MREALAGLTTRGRAFLAGGVTAIVCAVVIGESTLTRVGILVVALPLVTAFVVGRSRYRLALVRTVSPQVVSAGQPAQVSLTLTNEGRTPSGVLLLEDHLPYALGTRPRFVVEGVARGWRRQVTYPVRSELRGRFEIGPMTVRLADPFGMVELARAFRGAATLTVTPATTALPAISLGGVWAGSGDNRPRAFATGSAEDVMVREYRRGDDLRRVHWRSSARIGELMVRREEQPWQARATIFLDNRAAAHRGRGPASSLETAVSAAASVAVHLTQRGFAVRLVTAAGEDAAAGAWHQHPSGLDAAPLLEALAVVAASDAVQLDGRWLSEHADAGLTVAVLGAVSAADAPLLRRLLHHSGTGLALALDVSAWEREPAPASGPAGPLLAQQGWRTSTLRPGDQLAGAWAELGRGPVHAAGGAR